MYSQVTKSHRDHCYLQWILVIVDFALKVRTNVKPSPTHGFVLFLRLMVYLVQLSAVKHKFPLYNRSTTLCCCFRFVFIYISHKSISTYYFLIPGSVLKHTGHFVHQVPLCHQQTEKHIISVRASAFGHSSTHIRLLLFLIFFFHYFYSDKHDSSVNIQNSKVILIVY